jgi:hypothetical protein
VLATAGCSFGEKPGAAPPLLTTARRAPAKG